MHTSVQRGQLTFLCVRPLGMLGLWMSQGAMQRTTRRMSSLQGIRGVSKSCIA